MSCRARFRGSGDVGVYFFVTDPPPRVEIARMSQLRRLEADGRPNCVSRPASTGNRVLQRVEIEMSGVPSLENFDLLWFECKDNSQAGGASSSRELPKLRRLDSIASGDCAEEIAVLSRAANLEVLDLRGENLKNEQLRWLASLPKLTTLYLGRKRNHSSRPNRRLISFLDSRRLIVDSNEISKEAACRDQAAHRGASVSRSASTSFRIWRPSRRF